MQIELWQAALAVVLVTLVGSIIQRVTGFGFGIWAMIFLPTLLGGSHPQATLVSSLMSLISCAMVAFTMLKTVDWKNLVFPLIGYAAVALPCNLLLVKTDNTVLSLALGIALVIMSIYFIFFSGKIKIKPTAPAGLICGGLSGFMGGFFAMGGPPVVVYYLQSSPDKLVYLATIQMYFVMSNAYNTTVKIASGLLTWNVVILTAVGTIGMLAGLYIGKKIFNKLDGTLLRRIVYGFMAASGAFNIVKAIVELAK